MQIRGHIHAELERNWACAQSDPQARAAEIQSMPHANSRLFEQKLFDFAHRFPGITSTLLQRSAPEDIEIVGAGSQHTVAANQDIVIKINRRSVFLDEDERRTMTKEANAHHRLLQKYTGNLAVQQMTSIGANPLNRAKPAVCHVQEKVAYRSIDLFPSYEPTIDTRKLETVKAEIPGIESALLDITRSGLKMYQEQRVIPDVSGPDNLVLVQTGDTTELAFLDGLPVRRDQDSHRANRIAQLLNDLQSKL